MVDACYLPIRGELEFKLGFGSRIGQSCYFAELIVDGVLGDLKERGAFLSYNAVKMWGEDRSIELVVLLLIQAVEPARFAR